MAENYVPDPMPDSYETSPGSGGTGTAGTINVVKEADGSPSVTGVSTLVFSNGSVTDNGGGQVTVTVGGADGTLFGAGDPEGSVTGSRGDTYYDTSTQAFYVKASGDATNTGWSALIT